MNIPAILGAISNGQWLIAIALLTATVFVLIYKFDPFGLGSKIRKKLKIPSKDVRPRIKIDIHCAPNEPKYKNQVALRLHNVGNEDAVVKTYYTVKLVNGFGEQWDGKEIINSKKIQEENPDANATEFIHQEEYSYFDLRKIIMSNSEFKLHVDLFGWSGSWIGRRIEINAHSDYWDPDKIRRYSTPRISGTVGWNNEGGVLIDGRAVPSAGSTTESV